MFIRLPGSFTETLAITICVLTVALSTPFVALRLHVRRFVTSQIWWDDCSFSPRVANYHSKESVDDRTTMAFSVGKSHCAFSEFAGASSPDEQAHLSPEDGPLVITLLNSVHINASDDNKVIAAVLDLIQQVDSLAAQKGKSARYRFTNYGYKTQRILEGYGKDSLANLKAASNKYDPQGFFQNVVPGGFKLSQVSQIY